MDYLWTPWRYQYVSGVDKSPRQGVPPGLEAWPGDLDCVFCNMLAAVRYAEEHGMSQEQTDRAAHILHRGQSCYICLNAFPYSSGHAMIIPYDHQNSLAALPRETAQEMMDLAQQMERVLTQLYRPHGLNFGLNLGKAAGAGVAGHLHLHALPRWAGDTNFMTVISETRVLPEDLDSTWERMRACFAGQK